jgi:hypothetical protein
MKTFFKRWLLERKLRANNATLQAVMHERLTLSEFEERLCRENERLRMAMTNTYVKARNK